MAEFYGYNPTHQTWYEHSFSPHDGTGAVTVKQDVQPILDYCNEARNSGVNDKFDEFAHYAVIPPTVQVELLKRGVRFGRKEDTRKLLQIINQEFPHLKVTNLTHNVREFGT